MYGIIHRTIAGYWRTTIRRIMGIAATAQLFVEPNVLYTAITYIGIGSHHNARHCGTLLHNIGLESQPHIIDTDATLPRMAGFGIILKLLYLAL